MNSKAEDFLFDYIIVDEASQVDLLTSTLVMNSCKNLIVVGDVKQLDNIIENKLRLEQDNFDCYNIPQFSNYFENNLLTSILSAYPKVPNIMLKEHYRCHPAIIRFCNKQYYNNELIPYTKEDESDVLFIYRTSIGNHMRTTFNNIDDKEKGIRNTRELDVIKEDVLKSEKFAKYNKDEIGITTPFRLQAEKAKDLDNSVISDTIHKFQGREKDVMVLSTVLDSKKEAEKLLSFVDDKKMLNVAVSRAKKKFVLVINRDSVLEDLGREIKSLIEYIEYTTCDKNIINSSVVSVFDVLYQNYNKQWNIKNSNRSPAELLFQQLLEEVLEEEEFNHLTYKVNYPLKLLVKNYEKLTTEEKEFTLKSSHIDFLIQSRAGNRHVLSVEVDGVKYHRNTIEQQKRDKLKDSIHNKLNIEILRIETDGSGEKERLRSRLRLSEVISN